MHTPDELRDPALDWLGCEAMFSVPFFGLPQPTSQDDSAAAAEDGTSDPTPERD